METTLDISWINLALFSLTLIVPFGINQYYQLKLTHEFSTSLIRMMAQLILVGLYLEFVFEQNSLLLNLAWLIIMTLVGASSIVSRAKLPRDLLLTPVMTGLVVGLSPILILLFGIIIKPEPVYSAQYLIPVSGMLLGNSLSGNIVALQNLFTAFEQRNSEYEAALSLGASPAYSAAPFVREAMRKALAPILASMATTGIVTLPGMMTGQILGGASPMLAIKYQIIILIAIFVMMSVSLTLSLQLSLTKAVTKEGRVKVKFLEK